MLQVKQVPHPKGQDVLGELILAGVLFTLTYRWYLVGGTMKRPRRVKPTARLGRSVRSIGIDEDAQRSQNAQRSRVAYFESANHPVLCQIPGRPANPVKRPSIFQGAHNERAIGV